MVSQKDFQSKGFLGINEYFTYLKNESGQSLKTIKKLHHELKDEEFYFQLMEDSIFNEVFQSLQD
jgi:predicted glycosyltransferase involved in capsule biosynthesis